MGKNKTHKSKYNWTDEDIQFIRKNAAIFKDEDIAAHLSTTKKTKISRSAIVSQRRKLGIKKSRGRGKCKVLNVPVVETAPWE